MPGVRVLGAIAPLGLTLWVLAVATAVIVVLVAIGVARHLEWVRAERHRERVRGELEPLFGRFLGTDDPVVLGKELRPVVRRLNSVERPVAADIVIDIMAGASPAQADALRRTLEQAGMVERAERGTRRLTPWRRALACELLGKIGAERSVPVLLERLEDRRPEVRMAAVRALGDIGSPDALPALSDAFLARRCAPTNVVHHALRRIGGDAVRTFERGVGSEDPIVRVSSCFGLSEMAEERASSTFRLAGLLDTDPDARVRTAAAAALGILGGDDVPAALLRATNDSEASVRRSAAKALGSFDDPRACESLDVCTENEDRETALRAAEALLALTHRPRAAPQARARLEDSSAWAVEYARTVAEVSA